MLNKPLSILLLSLAGASSALANSTQLEANYTHAETVSQYWNADHPSQMHFLHTDIFQPTTQTAQFILTQAKLNQTQSNKTTTPALPKQVQLGMNNIPVFDQGDWGTCVTFATTAALDAYAGLTVGQNDISQTCSLQLDGTTLQPSDMSGRGWQGLTSAGLVLGQIQNNGYITSDELTHDTQCGGLTAYPTHSTNNGYPMSLPDFSTYADHYSKKLTGNFYYKLDSSSNKNIVNEIKTALAEGDRVIVKVSIFTNNYGNDLESFGKNKNAYDTWLFDQSYLSSLLEKQQLWEEDHEMVITGYDDNATATGIAPNGDKITQKGLFTLRDSFGPSATFGPSPASPDRTDDANGNHYMSYAYAANPFYQNWLGDIYVVGIKPN